jgi:hypothetical protein
MNDEGRFSRSWRMTKTAWAVVGHDRTLLALAAITGVLTLVLTGAYFACAGLLDDPGSRSRGQFLLWFAIFVWPLTFVGAFMSTALTAAGAAALAGEGRLTLGEALAVPARRIGAVLGWSLLSAGVGLLLQELGARIPFGGRVVAWLGGTAWGIATLFAIPVLVLEDAGPLRAAKRSAQITRERWGEALGGTVSIAFWAAIPSGIGGLLMGVGLALDDDLARALLIGSALMVFAVVAGLSGATRDLFGVALYRYGIDPSTGDASPFRTSDLADPPVRRRRRLRRPRRGGSE